MANDNSQQSHTGRKVFIWFVLIMVVGITATYLICGFTYSEGNRAGLLWKFSKKGFLFKTYEGELNMGGLGNVPNTAQTNTIWEFSVMDKATADTLSHMEGKKVSLHYREVVKNLWWQGETHFFVDGVQVIQ